MAKVRHMVVEGGAGLSNRPPVLLFGGLHAQPRGGAGDLIGWFESEAEARAAFRKLRDERSDHEGWAELVALEGRGRRRLLAWFGRSPATPLRPAVNRQHPSISGRIHLRLLSR